MRKRKVTQIPKYLSDASEGGLKSRNKGPRLCEVSQELPVNSEGSESGIQRTMTHSKESEVRVVTFGGPTIKVKQTRTGHGMEDQKCIQALEGDGHPSDDLDERMKLSEGKRSAEEYNVRHL
ncbi:uncharacterized protein HD556DRAFT_1305616 [Suillus plorans]|uniref:Uncharacterized protein n=1 Tax=Suillus plorans TaxID=116603 RepID=A0A9P7DNZ2_9AGAM|nr:uncharacterized protein HD556DRAFT_1305616 [Suillus plorans]KAG1799402.1 hypothetical protein HD556DRAFT_1305616 [Suillus plorans]